MKKKVASTTEKKEAQESLAGNGLKQMIQKYIRATSCKHRYYRSRINEYKIQQQIGSRRYSR